MISAKHIGYLAVLKNGKTVKILDVSDQIKIQDLDGNIKFCYNIQVQYLWDK